MGGIQGELDANLICVAFISVLLALNASNRLVVTFSEVSVSQTTENVTALFFPNSQRNAVFYQPGKIIQINENRFSHRHPEG